MNIDITTVAVMAGVVTGSLGSLILCMTLIRVLWDAVEDVLS